MKTTIEEVYKRLQAAISQNYLIHSKDMDSLRKEIRSNRIRLRSLESIVMILSSIVLGFLIMGTVFLFS